MIYDEEFDNSTEQEVERRILAERKLEYLEKKYIDFGEENIRPTGHRIVNRYGSYVVYQSVEKYQGSEKEIIKEWILNTYEKDRPPKSELFIFDGKVREFIPVEIFKAKFENKNRL